jgi:hypothetical protein
MVCPAFVQMLSRKESLRLRRLARHFAATYSVLFNGSNQRAACELCFVQLRTFCVVVG